MGKKKNKKKQAEEAPPSPEAPTKSTRMAPPAVTLALWASALGGAGYFVAEGVALAGKGRGMLAEQLLDVKSRAERPIPFTFQSLDGKQVSLGDYADKVVFVNFWATWCPPCVEEMPSMQRLAMKMDDDPRFVMLAVSADEGWPVVRDFFKRPPPFEVLLDKSGEMAKRYGTEKFPETYVIVDGRLVGYIVGPRNWDTWYAEDYLRALLAEGRHWGS